ncbi:hypothetical protein M427DRAFT_82656, partial [Gonapodya prolifera JEL478]
CFNCGGYGHLASSCWSPAWCFNCGGLRHTAADCSTPRRCGNCYGTDHKWWNCSEPEFCKHFTGSGFYLAKDCAECRLKKIFTNCHTCGGMYHFAED